MSLPINNTLNILSSLQSVEEFPQQRIRRETVTASLPKELLPSIRDIIVGYASIQKELAELKAKEEEEESAATLREWQAAEKEGAEGAEDDDDEEERTATLRKKQAVAEAREEILLALNRNVRF